MGLVLKSLGIFSGLRNRQTGSNSLNDNSSRSHSMLTLDIQSEMQDPDDENLYITKHGKLTFVDLAGSYMFRKFLIICYMFSHEVLCRMI